jgi:hypothetical protein
MNLQAGGVKLVRAHFTDNYGNEQVPPGNVQWAGSDDLKITVTQDSGDKLLAEVRSLGPAGAYSVQATHADVTLTLTVDVIPNAISEGTITEEEFPTE